MPASAAAGVAPANGLRRPVGVREGRRRDRPPTATPLAQRRRPAGRALQHRDAAPDVRADAARLRDPERRPAATTRRSRASATSTARAGRRPAAAPWPRRPTRGARDAERRSTTRVTIGELPARPRPDPRRRRAAAAADRGVRPPVAASSRTRSPTPATSWPQPARRAARAKGVAAAGDNRFVIVTRARACARRGRRGAIARVKVRCRSRRGCYGKLKLQVRKTQAGRQARPAAVDAEAATTTSRTRARRAGEAGAYEARRDRPQAFAIKRSRTRVLKVQLTLEGRRLQRRAKRLRTRAAAAGALRQGPARAAVARRRRIVLMRAKGDRRCCFARTGRNRGGGPEAGDGRGGGAVERGDALAALQQELHRRLPRRPCAGRRARGGRPAAARSARRARPRRSAASQVLARAASRARSRRPRRARGGRARRAGSGCIGSTAAQRSGTSSGDPPISSRATPPAAREVADGRLRDHAPQPAPAPSRRDAAHSASWPPAEWPSTETSSRSSRPSATVGEVVHGRGHVVEGVRPAAAAPEPAVLDVPRRQPAPREVGARRPS